MNRRAFFYSLMSVCLLANQTVLGQKQSCEFNIVGTWKLESSDQTKPILYRFSPDGTVTALSGSGHGTDLKELATATYKLDFPKAPKAISVTASKAAGGFAEGTSSMQITAYDDTSFTAVIAGSSPKRWVKVDPYKYFIVLAGRSDVFYDRSGPAFPMLIKTDGRDTQIDAVGIYSLKGNAAFGPIPEDTYKEFMKEPNRPSEVMLRLQLTAAQYERSLKIVQTWERRAREGALLYPIISLDNILLVKQVTEALNQCGEKVKVYRLDWGMEDEISENNRHTQIPFHFFKEMRKLNDSLHIRDAQFQAQTGAIEKSAAK